MKVFSIFESISGESGGFPQGSWCSFVRLYGCNLQCNYCDTKQQDFDYLEMNNDLIVRECKNKKVLITGGEPTLQDDKLMDLIEKLFIAGHEVQIETNGTYSDYTKFPALPIHYVIDIKCPCSGMNEKMFSSETFADKMRNLQEHCLAQPFPQTNFPNIKFVVSSEADIEFAFVYVFSLECVNFKGNYIFSPVFDGKGENTMESILEKIIARTKKQEVLDKLIYSLQIHKVINVA